MWTVAGPGTLSASPSSQWKMQGVGVCSSGEAENNSALGSNGEADFQTRFGFTTNVEKNDLFH